MSDNPAPQTQASSDQAALARSVTRRLGQMSRTLSPWAQAYLAQPAARGGSASRALRRGAPAFSALPVAGLAALNLSTRVQRAITQTGVLSHGPAAVESRPARFAASAAKHVADAIAAKYEIKRPEVAAESGEAAELPLASPLGGIPPEAEAMPEANASFSDMVSLTRGRPEPQAAPETLPPEPEPAPRPRTPNATFAEMLALTGKQQNTAPEARPTLPPAPVVQRAPGPARRMSQIEEVTPAPSAEAGTAVPKPAEPTGAGQQQAEAGTEEETLEEPWPSAAPPVERRSTSAAAPAQPPQRSPLRRAQVEEKTPQDISGSEVAGTAEATPLIQREPLPDADLEPRKAQTVEPPARPVEPATDRPIGVQREPTEPVSQGLLSPATSLRPEIDQGESIPHALPPSPPPLPSAAAPTLARTPDASLQSASEEPVAGGPVPEHLPIIRYEPEKTETSAEPALTNASSELPLVEHSLEVPSLPEPAEKAAPESPTRLMVSRAGSATPARPSDVQRESLLPVPEHPVLLPPTEAPAETGVPTPLVAQPSPAHPVAALRTPVQAETPPAPAPVAPQGELPLVGPLQRAPKAPETPTPQEISQPEPAASVRPAAIQREPFQVPAPASEPEPARRRDMPLVQRAAPVQRTPEVPLPEEPAAELTPWAELPAPPEVPAVPAPAETESGGPVLPAQQAMEPPLVQRYVSAPIPPSAMPGPAEPTLPGEPSLSESVLTRVSPKARLPSTPAPTLAQAAAGPLLESAIESEQPPLEVLPSPTAGLPQTAAQLEAAGMPPAPAIGPIGAAKPLVWAPVLPQARAAGRAEGVQRESETPPAGVPPLAVGVQSLPLVRPPAVVVVNRSAPPPEQETAGAAAEEQVQRTISVSPASTPSTYVIQRAETEPETSKPEAPGTSAEPAKSSKPNLDQIARDVLPLIKRLLAIERERRPGRW